MKIDSTKTSVSQSILSISKYIYSMLRSSYLYSYFYKTFSNDKKRNTLQIYKTDCDSFLRLFFRINYHEAMQQIAKLQKDTMYVCII